MSAFTGQELADFLYNRKIPKLYRDMDATETEKQDLYRYLQAVVQGGFDDTLKQITAMTDLVKPLTCPVEFLPYLYQSFGLPYFEDIGEYYNRRFLASVGELLRRRGTIGGVRYLVRVLTGMESEITYERITTAEEKARILNVYPVFPDVTSLAEIEVTSYTIKRFLELYLPFYIRLTFFPSIETQYLNGNIYNGVSFANTLLQYLFTERVRNLEIPNRRGILFSTSGVYNLIDKPVLLKNFLSGGKEENSSLDNLIYQKIDLDSKLVSLLGTRILSYDLTKLTGKKVRGVWTTGGEYKFFIPYYPRAFIEVFRVETDLYKPHSTLFSIPLYRMKGINSFAENDLKFERKKQFILSKLYGLISNNFSFYDFTGLSGKKLYSPNHINKKYSLEVFKYKDLKFTTLKVQDATFIEGKSIIADYSDVYNHSYNFKKSLLNMFTVMDLKSYNLKSTERTIEIKGALYLGTSNATIISYNLIKE